MPLCKNYSHVHLRLLTLQCALNRIGLFKGILFFVFMSLVTTEAAHATNKCVELLSGVAEGRHVETEKVEKSKENLVQFDPKTFEFRGLTPQGLQAMSGHAFSTTNLEIWVQFTTQAWSRAFLKGTCFYMVLQEAQNRLL